MSEIPYTVKTPLWYKLTVIPFGLAIFFAVPINEWIDTFQYGSWILRILFIGSFVFCLVGFLEAFLRKIDFDYDSIKHRNFLGFTKIKKYSEITEVIGEEQNLKIMFSDNSSIKVWTGEGNIHKVLRIIKKKREEK